MPEDRSFIAKQIANRKYTVVQRKGKSFIWSILRDVYNEDGNLLDGIVYCSTCRKILKLIGSQTSNLSRHTCCKNIRSKNHESLPEADKEEAIDTYVKWITEDFHPFSSVEGSGFVQLAKFFVKIGAVHGENVDINDLLTDTTIINKNIQKLANEKRNLISTEIKEAIADGAVSSTVSIWTDNYAEQKVLAVTIHFQRNFKQIDINLGLTTMDIKNTNSESILDNVKAIFEQFGVKDIRHIKFVTDKHDNSIVTSLENQTRLNSSSHLLKRVLDKSIENTSEFAETLQECKVLVKYFTNANFQHRLPILLYSSNSSNWNSNYNMIKSIVDNWSSINALLKEKEDMELLRSINLATLTNFIELSRDFEIIHKKMEIFSSPSLCFVLPSIFKIKSLCIPNQTDVPEILALKDHINYNVDQIWENNLSIYHKTALFLFPPALTKTPGDFSDAKEFCKTQLKNSKAINKVSTVQTKVEIEDPLSWSNPGSPATPAADTSSELVEQNTSTPKLDNTFFFSNWLPTSSTDTNNTMNDEVEKYSKEVVIMSEDFDLMQWWKNNIKIYPLLSKFAMQIHSIPASSAASEETILMLRNIITKERNDLGTESLSNSLFLHSFKSTYLSGD